MSGSRDNQRVEIVDVNDMALAVVCDMEGNVRVRGKGDKAWKAQVLRTILESLEKELS